MVLNKKDKLKRTINPPFMPGYLPPLYRSSPKKIRLIPERQEFATEGPFRVKFNADEIINKNGITTATGNVRAEYRGIVVKAQKIEFDQNLKDISAEGNVQITKDQSSIKGDSLRYSLESEKASIRKASGILKNSSIDGSAPDSEFFFWGDEVLLDKSITIKNADITSCDVEPPNYHYHITGNEIIIHPGDRMIIRKGRLFMGKSQVLGINSMVVPLKQRRKNQHFYIPRIGHNRLEGEYVKESIGYQWGKNDYGTVALDWFSKVGIGTGLEHYYHLGERGAGRFNYYSMGSSRSSTNRYDLSNKFYYRFPGNYFVSANYTANRYEYPEYSSPNIKNADFYVGHKTAWSDSALYIRDYAVGTDRNYGFNFFHNYDISDRLSTAFVVDYLSSEVLDKRRYRLNTMARLVQKGDVFDTWLILDHNRGDSSFYVNRLPEVSLRSHPFPLGPLDGAVSLSTGSFREMPSGINALRSDLKLSVLNKVFSVGKNTDLAFAAGGRQFLYGTGEKKYLIKTRAAMEERLGENFRVIFSHHYQDKNGFSPLAMDYYDKYHLAGATLELHNKEKFRFQVTGAYDIHNKIYQSIIPRIEVAPSKNTVFLLGSSYDYNNRLWMNIDGQVGFKLNKNVTLKYWGLYDLINKKMSYQNYVVELDSHDFATRLVYKGSQGEVWLNVALKAFPTDQVDIGADPARSIIPKDLLEGAPDEERL